MADRLILEVVTPERQLVTAETGEVTLPGALGELGVLPGHTPLLTSLGTGPLTYLVGAARHRLVVQGGFAEVLPERVTVMARVAQRPAEIDVDAARRALAESQAALPTADAADIDRLMDAVRLATVQLDVARDTTG